jgi:UDP-glucose 4-epimerase
MNILVLGGAGYIGSHVVSHLRNFYHPIVLDNLSKGHAESVSGSKFILGDLLDKQALIQSLTQHQIEAVIHFAAYSLVGESMENPAVYYENNVAGTLTLLDAMRQCGVNNLVFSSTAAVYGEPGVWPITEDQPTCPTNVYGRTKLMIEQIIADFSRAYGLQYVILRYFNAAGAALDGTIGEDHNPESHLIPLILRTALGQRAAIDVYGSDYRTADGTCIRDYIHVCDLAKAHILALEHLLSGKESRTYNLGSETGFSVRQVIDKAKEVTGIDFAVREVPRRSGDPAVLVASSQRIRQELGWSPQFSDLDTILRTAWQWHHSHPNGYNKKT